MPQKIFQKASVQTAMISGFVFLLGIGLTFFLDKNSYKNQVQDLKSKNSELEIKLNSFIAAADRRFPEASPDKRLDLLLNSVVEIKSVMNQIVVPFRINSKDQDEIINELSRSPKKQIILCCDNREKSQSMVDQITAIFEQCGFNVETSLQLGHSSDGFSILHSDVLNSHLYYGLKKLCYAVQKDEKSIIYSDTVPKDSIVFNIFIK